MTDARRRELERSGDLEARARALVEAVRAGELAQADLDLAADLAVEAARLATGRAPRPVGEVCAELALGPRLAQAACALGDLLLPAWTWPRLPELQGGEWVRDAVAALRAARDRGDPVTPDVVGNAFMAATEDDGRLSTRKALAAHAVALAAAAVAGTRGAPGSSLARAGRLAAGLVGLDATRLALAALLPAPLRPGPPLESPGGCSEADHLRRRLASGAPRERLELAGRIGHAAAAEALGVAAGDPATWEWAASLDPAAPFTHEVCVRVLLSATRASSGWGPPTPLEAAVAWVRAPGAATAAAALAASEVPLVAHRDLFGAEATWPDLAQLAARTCAVSPRQALLALVEGRQLCDPHELLSGLFRDVVPWLLGYRDALVDLHAEPGE